jgi:hypothetical protein
MFDSGLPDRAFVTDGDGASFHAALAHPETAANWIIMSPASGNYDPVWAALHDRTDWHQYYVLRQTFGKTQIYERRDTASALMPPLQATHPPAIGNDPYNQPRASFS